MNVQYQRLIMCVYWCMYVYTCYLCVGVYTYVSMCTCECVSAYLCLCVCWVACYSISDLFIKFKLGNRRFGVVPVKDPIPWWFEDQPMIWFGDPTGSCSEDHMAIRIQNCVISCEYLFLCIFLIIIVNRYICFTCIISCDHLIYYISIFICITSWGIVNV